MGGTVLTYNHAQPLVVERPRVTVVDDETDSGSFSQTSPSSHTSHTSHTSTQSDYPHPAKRQRTNSYNLQRSKSWRGNGNPDVLSASQIGTHSRPSFGHSFSSPLYQAVGGHDRTLAKEHDIQSAIASKSDLFSLVKYPWDNNPIAVAIWLAQKIHNIKKNQYSQPRMLDLQQGSPTNNACQRSKRRRSQVKNDAALYPASGVRFSGPGMFRESNSKNKGESRTTMNIERLDGEQSPSADYFSTKHFHYQMDLEARRITPRLAKLKRFKPGFGDSLFNAMADDHRIDADTAAAGKLVVNVLVALTCPESHSKCQAATDALLKVLDMESSLSPRFTKAFEMLSSDPDVTKAVDVIVEQINSCEFSLGLDGEYDAFSGLSNSYHSPKTSHSPPCVSKEQLSAVPRALENHLDSPQRRPSPSSSLSSSSSSSRHFLPENTITNTSVSMGTQNTSVPENLLSSTMPPRQSNRARKPTIRAMEAKLSSQARSGIKGQVSKALKRAEESIVASTSKESNDANSDMDATNKETSNASVADVDLAPAPSNKMAARSIDEIAALARLDGLIRTTATEQPKKLTATRSSRSRATTSAPSYSASTLSPETNAMMEQLLGLATAASKPEFNPEIEIDLHRARRDWYAEQLAAALNKTAAEKSLETDTAQRSQETAADDKSPLSSQPTTSIANVLSLETGVATPATPMEDFALSVSGCADSAVAKVTEASAGVAAAITPSSAQSNDAAERASVDQPAIVEKPIFDEAVEPHASRWPNSATHQKFLDPSVLSHCYLPRPWTDSNGWVHTGLGNEHNEENVIVPDTYTWIRPRDSFNNPRIAPSPPQMKSLIQIELDDAFGYPPPGRKPNLPLDLEGPFITEDVAVETEKAKVFRAARIRGIVIDRSTLLENIQLAIEKYDEIYAAEEAASSASDGNEIGKGKAPAKSSDTSAGTSKRTRASRKRTGGQALEIAAPKREDDEPAVNSSKTTGSKKRRLNTDVPIPASSSAGLGNGSGNLAEIEPMEVDSKPVLLAPRGPGRPSRRAAATAATAATRRTRQARQRRKRAPRQAQPESITPSTSEMVSDGPANNPVAAEIREPSREKDDVSTAAQAGQE
ncbi:hypothetical protein EMCG_07904 [[Emmonsia] crescens]|uniref:Uncharacterized protein n=1 Tax=[Emmonsia] crescens TaxID=73230 RepID=A0A0G2I852_9EURO|nr:hypothetical protein EMCG_07904 [Emmonsia crescens UAMH 3008]